MFAGVFGETHDDSATATAQSHFQRIHQRMPGWSDDNPLAGGNVGILIAPRTLDQRNAERFDP